MGGNLMLHTNAAADTMQGRSVLCSSLFPGMSMMNRISKIFCAILLSGVPWISEGHAAGVPIEGRRAMTLLCYDAFGHSPNPIVYNPFYQYASPIVYSVPELQMLFRVDGRYYGLNIKPVIEEALEEWRVAIPGLKFQEMTDGASSVQLRFNVKPYIGTNALAITHQRGSASAPVGSITLSTEGIEELLDKGRDELADAVEDKSSINILNIILKVTMKHEIGHVLGYDHTPAMAEWAAGAQRACQRAVEYPPPPGITPEPGIMTETVIEYLDTLRLFLGRPVRVGDIRIAAQEAAVGRAVFGGNCPTTPVQVNNTGSGGPPPPSAGAAACPPPLMVRDTVLSSFITDNLLN